MGIPCRAGVVDDGTQEGSQVGQAAGPDHISVGCSWDTSVQRCVAGRETSRHPPGFIPAKMTWKLQPLDTDVFSSLENRLRHLEFSARAETHSMLLQPLQRVVLQGQAIHQVLV